jgi:hypothetical protein
VALSPRRAFKPLGGAFLPGDSLAEVFDASALAILRFRVDGTLLSEMKVKASTIPVAVARAKHGWVLGSLDARGRLRLESIRVGDSVPSTTVVLEGSGDIGPAHLVAHQDQVWAAFVNPPFGVVRSDSTGVLSRVGSGAKTLAPDSIRSESDSVANWWVALPVLPLDNGSIQTLADLRSTARLVLLRNDKGAIVRTTRLNTPTGFVASVPRQAKLVAVKRRGGMEVVVFSWTWRD